MDASATSRSSARCPRGMDCAGPDAGGREGVNSMRRISLVTCTIVALAAMLTGCAKKTDTAAESSSDSLLASEPQQGNITPQAPYEQQQRAPGSPATPAPKPSSRPKPSSPS